MQQLRRLRNRNGQLRIPRIGPKTAGRLITRFGAIDQFPSHVLGDRLELALHFKKLATPRIDAPLFTDVEALRWRGQIDAHRSQWLRELTGGGKRFGGSLDLTFIGANWK